VPGSHILVQAIISAIDDYAEREMANREYFWNRPHSMGSKKVRPRSALRGHPLRVPSRRGNATENQPLPALNRSWESKDSVQVASLDAREGLPGVVQGREASVSRPGAASLHAGRPGERSTCEQSRSLISGNKNRALTAGIAVRDSRNLLPSAAPRTDGIFLECRSHSA
jgi:hypothetical protein